VKCGTPTDPQRLPSWRAPLRWADRPRADRPAAGRLGPGCRRSAGRSGGRGRVGELIIGGVGLARYLDPAKDAEKYAPMPTLGWDRAYRSGDLVRFEAEGLIFMGAPTNRSSSVDAGSNWAKSMQRFSPCPASRAQPLQFRRRRPATRSSWATSPRLTAMNCPWTKHAAFWLREPPGCFDPLADRRGLPSHQDQRQSRPSCAALAAGRSRRHGGRQRPTEPAR
jgi:hypothetical protein